MKISFDFDSTLGEIRTQKLALKFINDGHEVWITTSRMDDNTNPRWNQDVKSVSEKLGINPEHIQYTNGGDKWPLLKGFDIHFDDDSLEIELIEENLTNCVGVLILDL